MYLDKVSGSNLSEHIFNLAMDWYIEDQEIEVEKVKYDSSNNIIDNATDEYTYEEVRYVGTSPNNYVWFNCDSSWPRDDLSENANHCEKWRIIGIMDSNTTGNNNKLVKIIRDSIGNISWDSKGSGTGSSTSGNGSNDWSDSQLMMLLNPSEYLNQGYRVNSGVLTNTTAVHGRTYSVDNDGYVVYTKSDNITQNVMQMTYNSSTMEWAGGYYNRSVNTCLPSTSSLASGTDYTCNEVNYSNVGLKDSTKDYIQEIDWKIGGHNSISVTTNNMYKAERGITVKTTDRPTTWKGKVALMYPTDWALATSLSTETSSESGTYCKDTNLGSWGSYSPCYNNWLYTGSWTWTLTPRSDTTYYAFYFVSYLYRNDLVYNGIAIRPVLYLNTSTLVTGGSGTSSDPYQLML